MEAVLKGDDHTKITSTAPQGPEKVWVLFLACMDYPPVGQDYIGGQQIINSQAVLATKIAVTTAESQAAYACRRDDPADCG